MFLFFSFSLLTSLTSLCLSVLFLYLSLRLTAGFSLSESLLFSFSMYRFFLCSLCAFDFSIMKRLKGNNQLSANQIHNKGMQDGKTISSALPSPLLCFFLLWVAYIDNRFKLAWHPPKVQIWILIFWSVSYQRCPPYFIDGSLRKQLWFRAGLVHPTPPPFHAFPLEKEWRDRERERERERERGIKVLLEKENRLEIQK